MATSGRERPADTDGSFPGVPVRRRRRGERGKSEGGAEDGLGLGRIEERLRVRDLVAAGGGEHGDGGESQGLRQASEVSQGALPQGWERAPKLFPARTSGKRGRGVART